MKWVIGGLLLGVGGAVYSGRVPVAWVVYSFALMYGCWGLALFFAFTRSKQHGLLMLGITFFAAGAAAAALTHWWPLIAGFAISWVLRAMGMDPPPPPELTASPASTAATGGAAAPQSEGDKKT